MSCKESECVVKQTSAQCQGECGESNKIPTTEELFALQYKLFRKRSRTDTERRFCVEVCCGHLKAAIELYNQIKEKIK